MAFKPLYQASTAKPTSSFKPLGRLSNTAPTFELPTPAKKPSGFLNYIKSVPTKIKEAFASGGAQIESGVKTIRQGGTPIQGAEAGLKIGAGFAGVIFSPIAPVTDLIGKAIEFSGNKLSQSSYGKAIGVGEGSALADDPTTLRVTEALQNLGGIAMAILGAKSGELKGAKIAPEALAEVSKHPEVIKAVEKVYEAQTKATEVAIEKPTPSFKPIKPVVEANPLIAEAKKYKSAEEFVRAQGKPVFHGTDRNFTDFNVSKDGDFGSGVYLTNDKGTAQGYAELSGKGKPQVIEAYLNLKNPYKTDNYTWKNKTFDSFYNKDGTPLNTTKELIKKGYDGVEFTSNDGKYKEYVAFNPKDIKTKSQLTDIYNKATQTETPTTAQSGIGKSIEAKAIEAGLTEKFDKVASYDASTIKEQARIWTDTFNTTGEEGIRQIIRGEKPMPLGGKDFPFLVSTEAYLKEHPNFDMAYELANSPLATAASEAGSQLGLGQNRIQDSYTARIQEIRKARESKVKSADVKRTALRKKSQENLNKVNLTAEDLGKIESFIDKIIC